MSNETEAQEFIIARDDEKRLRFQGWLVAEASSRHINDTRWTKLELYRTTGDKYVAVEIGISQWQGEFMRHAATVCDDDAAVIEVLGVGWLAKKLYDEAGMECVENVE